MIDALNNDELIERVGGRFRLTALIQKRWLELLQGSRPLVDPTGLTELEVVVEEIAQGKVSIDYDKSALARPDAN
jgi:DNA-directed RNA polymerase subunit omega